VKAILRPPFPFFDIWECGGYAHGMERCPHTPGGARRIRTALSAVSAGGTPDAEAAMAGSLRALGDNSPAGGGVPLREGKFELIDGFKRYAAARQISRVDEPERCASWRWMNRRRRRRF